MAIIERDVSKAATSAFDLIIVGGATSLNHLRTVHGGLRYLGETFSSCRSGF